MNVFVTGATGFVGSHLCDWLERRGHHVWGLYRSADKRRDTGAIGVGIHGGLSTELDCPNRWLGELPDPLDAVVHVAGLTVAFRTEQFHRGKRVGNASISLGSSGTMPLLKIHLGFVAGSCGASN